MTAKVELDHGDAEILIVGSHIRWHGNLGLLLVGSREVLESLRWVSDGLDGDVLDDQVGEFKVWLCMLGAEVDLELYGFTALHGALGWLDPVVSLLIGQRDLL